MPLAAFLQEKTSRIDEALRAYMAEWDEAPANLRKAMEYSLFAGGKRLRPALALGAAEIVSGNDTPAVPAACAIEMIHTYSMIHDDLPAMDDDDLRRGKPTSHRKFGEAMAILAGDALLTMAFDVAARSGDVRVVREISCAAGVEGMVGGQVIDMESEQQQLALEELRRLHSWKTGALIRVSTRAGALSAGANQPQLDALTAYGEHLGLAYQIADDILDVVGDEDTLGKPIGSDQASQKATYPALVGLDQARAMAQEACEAAIRALAPFGEEADSFRALAHFAIERDH